MSLRAPLGRIAMISLQRSRHDIKLDNADGVLCRGESRHARRTRSGLRRSRVLQGDSGDHRGFVHRCELMRIPGEAADVDEAIAGAILEFERAQRVSDWTIAADCYEVQTQRAAV